MAATPTARPLISYPSLAEFRAALARAATLREFADLLTPATR